MKIIVLNGSPKGMISVTMQYVHFIQKMFPEHEFSIITISTKIKKIEKDESFFQEILDSIKNSDGVLWAFPVYLMLVPGNYKRFIELLFERKKEDIFKDKYTAVLTTSIKYFDHAAHYYMQAVCEDLGMKYRGWFSPEMYELSSPKGKEMTKLFAGNFLSDIQNKALPLKNYSPVVWSNFEYEPGEIKEKLDAGDQKIVILTDAISEQKNLINMTKRLQSSFQQDIEMINLNDVDIKGSCMGCLQCAFDHQCVYKDEFDDGVNKKIKAADIVVFSGMIRDRHLSSKWKVFLDRAFLNGHVPWMPGKQVALIVSGPLSQIPNITETWQVYLEICEAHLVGFVSDELGDSDYIDSSIDNLAETLIRYAEQKYVKPFTYLGKSSSLILREIFWGKWRFPFVADWKKWYKKNPTYPFPHKQYGTRMMNTILLRLSNFGFFRRMVKKNLKQLLLKPNEGALE